MSLTKLNYVPGESETVTAQELDDSPVLNTWYPFSIDKWKHAFSDVTLQQSGSDIPASAFEISVDNEYTNREKAESGKTLYGAWRIVTSAYAGIATSITGLNFGSYVDNETVRDILPLDVGDVDYDNSTSGLVATKVQAAIDEVISSRFSPTVIYAQLASSQAITTATETVINFTTGGFSSGVYTIPEDGVYLIRFRTLPSSSSPTTGNYRSIRLYIGSTIKDISTISTAKYTIHEVELYADLSKNDTVSAKFYHDAGSNVTLGSGSNTIANIARIS